MFTLYDCKMLECLGKGIWGLLKLAGWIAKTVLYNCMLKPLGKWGYKKYQERKARTAVKNLSDPVNDLTKQNSPRSERQSSLEDKTNKLRMHSENINQSLQKSSTSPIFSR